MEIDEAAARAQLSSADDAQAAATKAAFVPLPTWAWACFGLIGPGAIGFRLVFGDDRGYSTSTLNLIAIASVVCTLIVVGALLSAQYTQSKKSVVRLKSPLHGGPITKWKFAFSFAITFGFMATLQAPIDSNALIVAILSYAWLSVAPGFAWKKHVQSVTAS